MQDREKILKYLSGPPLLRNSDEGDFLPAICHVQLGNYAEAKDLFGKSILAMFTPPMLWKISGQPHWLVDVCILSRRDDLYADVRRELDGFAKKRALYFVYSDGLMELLLPTGEGISQQVKSLLNKPKIKDMYAIGLTLQAIFERDQAGFTKALQQLLQAHEGQAKHGDLRWTAEGLLCMPAMALAFVAHKQALKVNVTNDYLNPGYLEFLSEPA